MLRWGFIFLVIGVILAVLGFGNLGGTFVDIAKVLFFIAIAIFVVLLVLGLVAGKAVKRISVWRSRPSRAMT